MPGAARGAVPRHRLVPPVARAVGWERRPDRTHASAHDPSTPMHARAGAARFCAFSLVYVNVMIRDTRSGTGKGYAVCAC
jgi:hypothetical protein